ncbi:MAG: hypothetical protein IT212_07560 [Bacteroidia bacterium]|nr:hypothetical protein [Bacteroidia bacterium]
MESALGKALKVVVDNSDYYSTMLNGVAGDTTVTSGVSTIPNGVKIGSIEIVTNSAYNGTTGTATLQGSNDNSTFATVKQDDNSTDMEFTLATASTYTWYLKAVLFKYYRIAYAKGNASAGTVTANMVGKK